VVAAPIIARRDMVCSGIPRLYVDCKPENADTVRGVRARRVACDRNSEEEELVTLRKS
jgi:hypothetical protein